ncbi:L-Lysine--8-amino-7-oxononanoate transaminase [bioreactor metagenome]|uniref:L-Lysine--8-amino-7-oxononanoate transaminase n=1 Tax=bioreactor metagenome TaxID=1076179 RepID=A0A644SVW7_9ZZZZ|nr:adenosylmethionine--8-amino-7-oxononanoate transaminase [Negativicutes bacterium]
MNNIELKDKQYLWHPFTQMKDWTENKQVIIAAANGTKLIDTEGNEYYDGVSSLWVNIHGHRKAELNQAIIDQLDKIAHSTMLGLINIPATELAEQLVKITPPGLEKVFYSDDGSTAVEVALKMAFQYWQFKGQPNKQKFIALNQAYHGDTVGTVSVGGIDLFHRVFKPLLFAPIHIPSPSCYHCQLADNNETCGMTCLEPLEQVLTTHHTEIAGLIIEPLVQAAAGMLMSPPGYLKKVRLLTEKYNVLLIADEVATGFGRTGKMFACEHEAVSPDLMALSKGITGGYLPLAATLTTNEIYNTFLGEYTDKRTFYHGHSYTGNQLACAVALANLKVFRDEKVIEGLASKIETINTKLEKIKTLNYVGNVRHRGMIVGIELMKDKQTKKPFPWSDATGAKVCLHARKYGLMIRPVGDVVIFMPPLSSTTGELTEMLEILYKSIQEVTETPACCSGLAAISAISV